MVALFQPLKPPLAMLSALVAGTTDPAILAELARGRLRTKLPALRAALAGRFRGHHAFLVSQMLGHLDYLDEALQTLTAPGQSWHGLTRARHSSCARQCATAN